MRRLVAEARVGRLGTVDEQGRAHVVPFVFALDGDTLYTAIDHKPKTTRNLRRLENVRRDPRATVLVDHYEDDWERLWWVCARGTARLLEGGEERDRGARLLAGKYAQYREHPIDGIVVAIDVEDWSGWEASRE